MEARTRNGSSQGCFASKDRREICLIEVKKEFPDCDEIFAMNEEGSTIRVKAEKIPVLLS